MRNSCKIATLLLALNVFSGQAQESNNPPTKKTPIDPRRILVRPLNDAELWHQHLAEISFQSSAAVYLLPQINASDKLDNYTANYQSFLKSLPPGYSVYGADGGVSSGLKFVILKPALESDPWILSVAGTENILDWLVDAGLGMTQFKECNTIAILFGQATLANKPVLITGHSLGGGLAQALAHNIQTLRNEHRHTAQVSLITWNAMGSQTLIERGQQSFNPELLKQIVAYNYFVKGDPVSRVDRHFGPMYEVKPSPRKPKYTVRPDGPNEDIDELKRCHALKTLHSPVFDSKAYGLRSAIAIDPPPAEKLNGLTKITGFLTHGTKAIHSFRQVWVVKKLTTTLNEVEGKDFSDPARAQTIRYLYNIAVHEPAQLRASSEVDREKFAPPLEDALRRLHLLMIEDAARSGPLSD